MKQMIHFHDFKNKQGNVEITDITIIDKEFFEIVLDELRRKSVLISSLFCGTSSLQ